jgi:hypothetical protein
MQCNAMQCNKVVKCKLKEMNKYNKQ